jgi:hypothetical protein
MQWYVNTNYLKFLPSTRSPAQLFDHVGIICLSLFLETATFIWCLQEEGTTKPLRFMVKISSIKDKFC